MSLEHVTTESLQNGTFNSGAATGTNTYALTLSPAVTAYTTGQVFNVLFTNANTGAVTLNVNALGAKAVKRNGSFALVEGDILAGQVFALYYDGTDFQLIGRVSTNSPIGNMYISSSAETTISTVSTPVKAAGTTTLITSTSFDMPANNRLRYTGIPTQRFEINAALSMSSAGSNKVSNIYLAKNGTIISDTLIQRKISNANDVGALAIVGTVELSTNDYIELWIENTTDSGNLTVDYMNILIQ